MALQRRFFKRVERLDVTQLPDDSGLAGHTHDKQRKGIPSQKIGACLADCAVGAWYIKIYKLEIFGDKGLWQD